MGNPVPVSGFTIRIRKGVHGKEPAPNAAAAAWERPDVQAAGQPDAKAPGSWEPSRRFWKRKASVKAWVEGTPRELDVPRVATPAVRDSRTEKSLEVGRRMASVVRINDEEAGTWRQETRCSGEGL